MNWAQVSDGEWRVPLDRFEGFMVKLGVCHKSLDHENYAIYLKAEIRMLDSCPSPTPKSLRAAWAQLRFECPNLATWIDSNTNEKVYNVPSRQGIELQEWLDSTLVVVKGVRDAGELMRNLKPQAFPTMHYLSQSSEFVFRCSHWRIDGIGAHMMMDRFCTLLAKSVDMDQILWGEETKKLSPSVETAAGVPLEADAAALHMAQETLGKLMSTVPPAGLCYKGNDETRPRQMSHHNLSFTPSSTSKIVNACKEHGTTVTVALQAATMLAQYLHASPETKLCDSLALLPQDLRPYL
ncbi:MAG: hypothetical protein Q9159_003647 [Coniocarpon cinnabarinum]